MKVENMISSKGNTISNQFIIKDWHPQFDILTFQSYKSEIATLRKWNNWDIEQEKTIYTKETLILKGSMWDYSNTTRKYFKQFINSETPFTYENKAQWLKEIENNKNIEVL